jgi:hypothetical protein
LDQHFDRLLTFLSEDPEEAGRLYMLLHQKLEGYFRFNGLGDPGAAADEALDRAARRIAEGTEIPDINKFCIGIARFIVMEEWRKRNRESDAFSKFAEPQSVSEADLNYLQLMKECFNQLPANDRELLNSYCTGPGGRSRAEYRRKLADRLHMTVTAMRIRVMRLRQGLEDCVKKASRRRS